MQLYCMFLIYFMNLYVYMNLRYACVCVYC